MKYFNSFNLNKYTLSWTLVLKSSLSPSPSFLFDLDQVSIFNSYNNRWPNSCQRSSLFYEPNTEVDHVTSTEYANHMIWSRKMISSFNKVSIANSKMQQFIQLIYKVFNWLCIMRRTNDYQSRLTREKNDY